MSDLEFEVEDEHDVSASHSKLLESIQELDKTQRIKKPERSEPSTEISEFHLVKSGVSDQNVVKLQDLAKSLGQKGHHDGITKQFKKAKSKATVLPKPLEKPVAERIKRKVGFQNTRKELSRWDGIVARNRTVGHITFPLQRPAMKMQPDKLMVNRFRLKSDLEKELEALDPKQEEKVEDEKVEYGMTLEDLVEKRKEAAKLRAQESYVATKARRQNKIKSKKFHRIQRKEKLKKQIKEFEQLQITNPEAALEKLELLEKIRVRERMSLRHKNTGQWAKNKQVRAKYNQESREALAQQLSISRELTQKIKTNDESDEEDENAMPPCVMSSDKDNPWINGNKSKSDIDEFVTSYKKFWSEKNAMKEKDSEAEKIDSKETSDETPEISQSMNPVENVIICSNEELGESKPSAKPKKSRKRMKNSQEKSKHGPAESQSKKQKTECEGTSKWAVEIVDCKENQEENTSVLDINDLFDSAERKAGKNVESNLVRIKEKLQMEFQKRETPEKRVPKNKSNDYLDKLSLKQNKIHPVIDEAMSEVAGSGKTAGNNVKKAKTVPKVSASNEFQSKSKEAEIDPTKFINMKTKLIKTQLPSTDDMDALDDSDNEEKQYKMISEAFADDDVVEEFRKEKQREIKKGQPEDIDLSMPGWGSWGGQNIVLSAKKRKRFIMKFPKVGRRKDENKGDVVIIEENNAKIRKHQVSDLPFPFKSVKDFEASMRAPIGRNFVPEKIHRKMIEPAVKTRMGKIIEPMGEDALVKKIDKKKKWFI